MSVLVTVLCSQPRAFASDLGDDQSRYLYTMMIAGSLTEMLKPFSATFYASLVHWPDFSTFSMFITFYLINVDRLLLLEVYWRYTNADTWALMST